MENKLIASSSPHIRHDETTQKLMLDVIIALLPALVASVFYFGTSSIILVVASVASAVITEFACQKFMNRPITVTDLSAVVTGMLLAFNLPATAPWWVAVVGSAFAIAIVKQIFGGIGFNFLNPALAARAFLMASIVSSESYSASISSTSDLMPFFWLYAMPAVNWGGTLSLSIISLI